MIIRRQSSLNKINYETLGQLSLFGRDNLSFKTVNLPKAQRYDNLCNKFRLKKIIKIISLTIPIIVIKKI
jgi:hypothetical protein